MIKLKNILNEITDDEKYKKMAYSWQKPNGSFVPIKYSHGSDAWTRGGKQPKIDYVMEFWKRGWNRIHHDSETLFCHNEISIPNDKQKSALIDLAINLDLQKLTYDSGEDYKILWSKDDVLENNLRK